MKRIIMALFLLYMPCMYSFSDDDALRYCQRHADLFVAIMWPIAQGKQEKIEKIFNEFGRILYQKTVYFTPESAYKILKKAHPQIIDMDAHVRWYFPRETFNYPARIFLFKCKDAQTATLCKYKIRSLYKLQYRPVHINDTYEETLELAHIFFNNKNYVVL